MSLNPKMQRLQDWLFADPTNRGYAGMADNDAANDMVNVELLPAGTMTAHHVRQNINMLEVTQLWDGDAAARARIQSVDVYLAGFGNLSIPTAAVDYCKLLVQRAFGAGSQTRAGVDALLDGDTTSRHEMLGFSGETVAQMTNRIARVRAAPQATSSSSSAGGDSDEHNPDLGSVVDCRHHDWLVAQ